MDLNKELRSHLAVPAVVHFYAWLLAGYAAGNGAALNAAVTGFLWRLASPQHLGLEPMLYQVGCLAGRQC